MSKALRIPPSKHVPGLHVYCSKCDTIVSETCKLSDLPIEKCKNGDRHRFKGIVYVEGNTRKTKTFGRNYDEAVEGVAKLRNETKGKTSIEEVTPGAPAKLLPSQEIIQEQDVRNYDLARLMAKYVGFLSGDETVPIFKRKKRSNGHVKDVERTFLRFMTAAHKNRRNIYSLRIDRVDDGLIGEFYKYLTEDLELGNAGYNRAMTVMTSFFTYLNENEGYQVRNPFVEVVRRPLKENVETIESEQFSQLLEAMEKPELGIHTFSNGKRKNYWRSFLPQAIELVLYSGRRRTEAVLMKWKDIVYKNDIAEYIAVPDYKVNKKKNLEEKDWKYNYAPITAEFADLLQRMGEEDHRHSDRYILAPEDSMSRSSMASFISKSFAHYAEQIGIDLSLGSLRRTNFSSLSAALGMENARTISGHSGVAVMKRHYISKRVLAKAAQEFNVFDKKKQNPRQNGLSALRDEQNDISIER